MTKRVDSATIEALQGDVDESSLDVLPPPAAKKPRSASQLGAACSVDDSNEEASSSGASNGSDKDRSRGRNDRDQAAEGDENNDSSLSPAPASFASSSASVSSVGDDDANEPDPDQDGEAARLGGGKDGVRPHQKQLHHVPADAHERTSRDYYFDSYAHHAIHEEMLKDEVRTRTYQLAILENRHLFKDKVVLDVGCGTGILSMFAAQAGARHVYAVDCSSIIEQARKIVQRNGFQDKITLIRGKIEEIDLPVPKVDIIVHESMGYFLLYESMVDSVIYARDKWLVPNGVMMPDKFVMYVAAVEDGSVRRERFDFWSDVYGFNMETIRSIALREPVVDVVDPKAIVTDSKPILHLDLLTCKKEDLQFSCKFKLQAQRNDFIHGLVGYFECAFTQLHKPIGFSTAPFSRYTHWKQTMFYLEEAVTICAGETVSGEISCKPNKRNRRDLDIGLALKFKGRYSRLDGKTVHYRLR